MKDKMYKQISLIVDSHIQDIYDYFSIHNKLFKRRARKTKSSSYGGYELTEYIGEFNQSLNKKCDELLEIIDKFFVGSGRKLSSKQYDDLIKKCIKPFNIVIDNYSRAFQDEFDLNATFELSLNASKGRMTAKISGYIKALKILTNTKIDKALWWTGIGTIFAGISLILSIIAICLRIQ